MNDEAVLSSRDTVVTERGVLTDREISEIQAFIKDNYKDMYLRSAELSKNGFYNGR